MPRLASGRSPTSFERARHQKNRGTARSRQRATGRDETRRDGNKSACQLVPVCGLPHSLQDRLTVFQMARRFYPCGNGDNLSRWLLLARPPFPSRGGCQGLDITRSPTMMSLLMKTLIPSCRILNFFTVDLHGSGILLLRFTVLAIRFVFHFPTHAGCATTFVFDTLSPC